MNRRLTMPPTPADWHNVIVVGVADGDTIRVSASLGLGIELTQEYVRLLGVQAPELNGPQKYEAQEARRALSALTLNKRALLHCPANTRDRYGRWLGYLWHQHSDHLHCINRWLVDNGYAQQWAPKRHRFGRDLPPEIVALPTLTIGSNDA